MSWLVTFALVLGGVAAGMTIANWLVGRRHR